jgi:hypothetical protein
MPDFWVHIIAGEEVKNSLKEDFIQELINNNYQLFNFACQGADPFFYYKFWPWQHNKIGWQLAEDIHQLAGQKLFAALLTAYKKADIVGAHKLDSSQSKKLIYLLGFIVHYTIDRECHPYILANGGQGKQHKLIESMLDVYLMQEYWQQQAAQVNPVPYYKLTVKDQQTASYFYQIIIEDVLVNFSEQFRLAELLSASYLALKKYHKFFTASSTAQTHLLETLNYLLPINLAQYNYQLAEKQQKRLWSDIQFAEFDQLYKQAILKAVQLINKTFLYLDGAESLSNLLRQYGKQNFLGQFVE